MTRDICLHLVLPKSLEDPVIDQLLRHPAWVGPFVTHSVDGHISQRRTRPGRPPPAPRSRARDGAPAVARPNTNAWDT